MSAFILTPAAAGRCFSAWVTCSSMTEAVARARMTSASPRGGELGGDLEGIPLSGFWVWFGTDEPSKSTAAAPTGMPTAAAGTMSLHLDEPGSDHEGNDGDLSLDEGWGTPRDSDSDSDDGLPWPTWTYSDAGLKRRTRKGEASLQLQGSSVSETSSDGDLGSDDRLSWPHRIQLEWRLNRARVRMRSQQSPVEST